MSKERDYSKYSECDLSNLSDLEKEILLMKISGMSYKYISENKNKNIDCVHSIIKNACKKLDTGYSYKQKQDLSIYSDNDLKCLSEKYRRIFLLKKSGVSNEYIAKQENITSIYVSRIIYLSKIKIEKYKNKIENEIDYSKYSNFDLDNLSNMEKEYMELRIIGKTNDEIAQLYGTKARIVKGILKKACHKLDVGYVNKYKFDYSKYAGYNLDNLSENEKTYIQLRIEGKTNNEIAQKYNVTRQYVSSILLTARNKLDNGYVRGKRGRRKKEIDYSKYAKYNLSNLTKKERLYMQLAIEGKTNEEIAKMYDVSCKSINKILRTALYKLDNEYIEKDNHNSFIKSKRKKIDYSKYSNYDLSNLSERTQDIFSLKISGKSNKEIAEMYKISPGNVSSILYNAAIKLDIGYVRKRKARSEESFVRKKYDYTKYSEYDLELLSDKERNILDLKIQGKTNIEIASIVKTSTQYISKSLSNIRYTLDNRIIKKHKTKTDYEKYSGYNLEPLSDLEKDVLLLKIQGKTNGEIAIIKKVNVAYVGTILSDVRYILDNGVAKKHKNRIDYSKYFKYDMNLLTDFQKDVLLLKIQGKTNNEIALIKSVTLSYVGKTLFDIRYILDNGIIKKRKESTDYSKYSEYNLDNLSEYQRRVLEYAIKGKSVKEIAELEGKTIRAINSTLNEARRRLDIGYVRKNRNKSGTEPGKNKHEQKINDPKQNITNHCDRLCPSYNIRENDCYINNIIEFVEGSPEKMRGVLMDKTTNQLCAINIYSAIMFDNGFTMHTGNNDEENISIIKRKCITMDDKNVCKLFDDFNNNFYMFYSIDYVTTIKIREYVEKVKSLKLMFGFRTKKLYYSNVSLLSDFSNDSRFGIKFNSELMLDVAKCLDKESVAAYFPIDNTHPIIVTGKNGIGLINPIVAKKSAK